MTDLSVVSFLFFSIIVQCFVAVCMANKAVYNVTNTNMGNGEPVLKVIKYIKMLIRWQLGYVTALE